MMTVGVLADGGEESVPISVPPGLIVAAAIVVIVLLLLAGAVAALAYWRLKRSGKLRTLTMTAESQLRPAGAKRDLADLSIELDAALEGARSAASSLTAGGVSGDVANLATRLSRTAQPLAERLYQARRLSDDQLERLLPGLFAQVRNVQAVSERLQAACDATTSGLVDADLAALMADADREIAILGEGVRTYRELDEGNTPST